MTYHGAHERSFLGTFFTGLALLLGGGAVSGAGIPHRRLLGRRLYQEPGRGVSQALRRADRASQSSPRTTTAAWLRSRPRSNPGKSPGMWSISRCPTPYVAAMKICSSASIPRFCRRRRTVLPQRRTSYRGPCSTCAVGGIIWSTVVAYDQTRFSRASQPRALRDFFNVDRFPGKRGLRRSPRCERRVGIDRRCIPVDQVYEVLATTEGVDRAFDVLGRLKPHVVWWEAGAQPPQLLADGEVVMTSAYNGRLYNAIFKEKKPSSSSGDSQVWDVDLWGIIKGTGNMTAALEFVKFSTDTKRLADQARYISYGPVRRSSMDKVNTKVKPHLPTSPDNFAARSAERFRLVGGPPAGDGRALHHVARERSPNEARMKHFPAGWT